MINENTYTEVYEILSYMDKMTVMKIPIELLKFIKENKNDNFNTLIDKNDLFNMNNISPETKHVLAWLDVNYWMSKEKKECLKEKYYKNHMSFYNSEKIFKKATYEKMQEKSNITGIMEYKESMVIKLINKLKKFLGKN